MQKLYTTLLILLLTTAPWLAVAAPIAYSVNSDSGSDEADSLYRIDLDSGQETRIAPILSLGDARIDVEGLAFAPDGRLFGLDDASMTLFPLDTASAQVQTVDEEAVTGLQSGGGNDFGMTFACDGKLYVSSVVRKALYLMELDGSATFIGSLPANIGALAAYGSPVQLYGLGNGLDGNLQKDAPSLFRIDPANGATQEIGPLGAAVGDYSEGGLAFDDTGQLWAITDRRQLNQPSQVARIDLATGKASGVFELSETGFESLAITPPGGCRTVRDSGNESTVNVPALNGPGILLAILLILVSGLIVVPRRS
jgi:hypothetical protein